MRSYKDWLIDFIVSLFLVFWILIGVTIFSEGENKPPLIEAKIPQKTIDFFTGLVDFTDIGVIFNPSPNINDWGKYESISDMKFIEDSCFIIFYSSLDSLNEQPKAKLALRYCNEAIPKLEAFMKGYPYPFQVRNHKLSIFLAPSEKSYNTIIKQLGIESGSESSIGIYIYQISEMGTLAKGIVISPEAWENKGKLLVNDDLQLKKTLWHEMNHYVFFTNYNYHTNTLPYLWFTEGCAEYFSEAIERNNQIDKEVVKQYNFSINTKGSEVYWIGYSAFIYYEKKYGRSLLSDLVYHSYSVSIDHALAKSSRITLQEWENGWKNYIFKSFPMK
jgi:hypothetical protein